MKATLLKSLRVTFRAFSTQNFQPSFLLFSLFCTHIRTTNSSTSPSRHYQRLCVSAWISFRREKSLISSSSSFSYFINYDRILRSLEREDYYFAQKSVIKSKLETRNSKLETIRILSYWLLIFFFVSFKSTYVHVIKQTLIYKSIIKRIYW